MCYIRVIVCIISACFSAIVGMCIFYCVVHFPPLPRLSYNTPVNFHTDLCALKCSQNFARACCIPINTNIMVPYLPTAKQTLYKCIFYLPCVCDVTGSNLYRIRSIDFATRCKI